MRFSSQPEPFSGSGRFPDHLLIVRHPYKFIPNSTTPPTTKHPYILPVFLRKTPMRHETCALAFAI